MPKLFISYRRKSWGFTHRLADELRARLDAEIFVDVDNVDQADFELSIVNHLRKSDAVLLVVSETTFADRIHRDDDWVRREIREAIQLNIPLVLVCVEGLLPPAGLPDDIKDLARMQGVNFYPDYFTPAVEKLTDFVTRIAPVTRKTAAAPAVPPASTPAERLISGNATLDEVATLMEQEDFGKAIFLLETLRNTGFKSRFIKIDELLQTATQHQQTAERLRQAKLEYDEIAPVAKSRITRAQGLAAFEQWCAEYPDLADMLDAEKLRDLLSKPTAPAVIQRRSSLDLLPTPFEWITIPAGQVTLVSEKVWAKNYVPEGKSQTFSVAQFAIARYPLTNAQYRPFIEAGGYDNQQWWTAAGWEARGKGWEWDGEWKETGNPWTQPRFWMDATSNGDEQPVVGVSWYEAVAYCNWLSAATGESIRLPSEQEWQRAAQGDDGRDYPWGKKWDASRCNNNVDGKGIGRTTPVRQYQGKGDSPFGVVDMAGNVWEWCATAYESGSNDVNGTDVRVLRGGSWFITNTERFRCVVRDWVNPHGRVNGWGFRLALS